MTIIQDEMAAFLSPYLDGELSVEGRSRVEAHLSQSPYFQAELETLR